MSTLSNIWKIKELRSRILFTLGLIFICRLVAVIPTPGVDIGAMKALIDAHRNAAGGLVGMLDIFTGGALERCSVGTLSIWPYINASIIIQLMTAIIPSLEKMAREGDVGRQKLTQVTRYLTLVLCAGQAYAIAAGLGSMTSPSGAPIVPFSSFGFRILTVIAMTSATMLVMWLGEQITERGIGNGMSVIIMVNICARLPGAIYETFLQFLDKSNGLNFFTLVFLFFLAFIVFAGTILLTDGVRKVPVHTARGAVGGRVAGGRSTYMPLRVNYAGVMPIIFAGPILAVVGWLFKHVNVSWLGWLKRYGQNLSLGYDQPGACFILSYAALILFFCFFWIATQFNAVRIADDMKASNSYVPGIRPGMPTAEFLDLTMTRVTFIGAIGLIIIALLPSILRGWGGGVLPAALASFFGGTSLLIIVGVALDTMRQIESYLVMREYDGFLKHGRIRGRAG